jgi:NAD-dependent deacetylase
MNQLAMPADLQHRLARCQSATVLTGAGVSAESGIPTFRGAGGLWKNYKAEELATPQAFQRNPELVWQWYDMRRQIIAKAIPNNAHNAIVELERIFPSFHLVTQNIDGLHEKAGSRLIIEIHGNIWQGRCTECAKPFALGVNPLPFPELPACPDCHALARPHVVWFGESYDPETLNQAIRAMSGCDLLVVCGTSGMVSVPVWLAGQAREKGALVLEFNLEESQMSELADSSIFGPAGDTLPELIKLIKRLRN